MKDISIYVHIPFCKQKCYYCDFCSFSSPDNIVKKYFQILNNEIKQKSVNFNDYIVRTIYFGGGTPSSVEEEYILKVLASIKKHFIVDDSAEITIECNPCTIDEIKLQKYKNSGFNRISFGVQSFNDKVLKSIGRLHTSKQAEQAILLAKSLDFDSVSCDLMIGLPYQTEQMLKDDIKKIFDLGVDHVSCYMLQLEENTLLFKKVKSKELVVMAEDEQARLYDLLVRELANFGYEQYEVSNFAKNKAYSKHNLNYWRRGEYLGFGLSAHSFIEETRFANSCDFEKYEKGEDFLKEKLSNKEISEEIVMLGLRYFEGIDISKWQKYDKKMTAKLSQNKFLKKGMLTLENGVLRLKPEFYVVNNEIISSFFD